MTEEAADGRDLGRYEFFERHKLNEVSEVNVLILNALSSAWINVSGLEGARAERPVAMMECVFDRLNDPELARMSDVLDASIKDMMERKLWMQLDRSAYEGPPKKDEVLADDFAAASLCEFFRILGWSAAESEKGRQSNGIRCFSFAMLNLGEAYGTWRYSATLHQQKGGFARHRKTAEVKQQMRDMFDRWLSGNYTFSGRNGRKEFCDWGEKLHHNRKQIEAWFDEMNRPYKQPQTTP